MQETSERRLVKFGGVKIGLQIGRKDPGDSVGLAEVQPQTQKGLNVKFLLGFFQQFIDTLSFNQSDVLPSIFNVVSPM